MGGVDMKGIRRLAFPLCLLVPIAGTTGCSYDYPDQASTSAASADGTSTNDPIWITGSSPQTVDPLVLQHQVRNYQDLDALLKAVPGPVLLSQKGPMDGPARGFGGREQVPAAGQYTVTVACVGAAKATIFIRQEHPTVTLWPVELTVDCPGTTSQVITLQKGYVSTHLSLPSPGDTPWTGAVGGVRVTG
jgi:hypothetical protein